MPHQPFSRSQRKKRKKNFEQKGKEIEIKLKIECHAMV